MVALTDKDSLNQRDADQMQQPSVRHLHTYIHIYTHTYIHTYIHH